MLYARLARNNNFNDKRCCWLQVFQDADDSNNNATSIGVARRAYVLRSTHGRQRLTSFTGLDGYDLVNSIIHIHRSTTCGAQAHKKHVCFFALGTSAKYCHQRVCMSVCLSVCLSVHLTVCLSVRSHISKTHFQMSLIFSTYVCGCGSVLP